MIPKYPMSDFHEINLDYLLEKYFEIDKKLTSQIAGLKLEVNAHNILLKDADNNVLASIVAPYANEANTAASATRASNADEADVAIKDALGNHIVSYIKDAEIVNNVIILKDGNDGVVASLPVSAIQDKFVITAYITENTDHLVTDDDLVATNHCRYYMPDITSYDDYQTWEAALSAALNNGTPIIIYLYTSPESTRYLNRIVWDDTTLINCSTFINSFTLGRSWDANKGAAIDFTFNGSITYA